VVFPVLALTFVELLTIDKKRFDELLRTASTEDYKIIRKAVLRLTLIRGVKLAAEASMRDRVQTLERQTSKGWFARYDTTEVVLDATDDFAQNFGDKGIGSVIGQLHKDFKDVVTRISAVEETQALILKELQNLNKAKA